MSPNPIRSAECADCGGTRNCDVIGHHTVRKDDGSGQSNTDYFILRCRGCDYCFMQTSKTHEDNFQVDNDEFGNQFEYYPEYLEYFPAITKRQKPDWLNTANFVFLPEGANALTHVPSEGITLVLDELYKALNSGLHMLAAIGIRTAIDVASARLGVDPARTFSEKLQDLEKGKYIQRSSGEYLGILVDAGSAAAHRGWIPTSAELHTLMTALENFLYDAFVASSDAIRHRQSLEELRSKVRRPQRLRKSSNT